MAGTYCYECRYSARVHMMGDEYMECRLHPPVIVDRIVDLDSSDRGLMVEDATCFPVVYEECWCGQFSPKTE